MFLTIRRQSLPLLLSTALLAVMPQRAVAQVSVQLNQQQYQFATAPRLAEVLAPQAEAGNWYWPASKLYQLNTPAATALAKAAYDELTLLLATAGPQLQPHLTLLRQSLPQWQLAERIVTPIDYDRARLDNNFNPGLPSGEYVLQLTERPAGVQLFGAVTPQQLALKPGQDVRDYLAALTLPAYAETEYFYLLQGDGRLLRVQQVRRNSEPLQAMPGSVLIVPFKESLFSSRFRDLNRLLSELALHRVW